MINKTKIENNLTTTKLGKNLELFKEIGLSTNDYLAGKAREGVDPFSAVVALVQRAGKGRMGRKWESGEEGESIALSIYLTSKKPIRELAPLTLISALAVREAIVACADAEKIVSKKIKIKWPNDILINGKKVCGILCEVKTIENKNAIIIGIGINVAQKTFSDEIKTTATSLALEKIEIVSIEKLIAQLLNRLEEKFDIFEENGFAPLQEKYESVLAGCGEVANVKDANEKIILEGEILGVNACGELIIEDGAGNIHEINSGEVSIRGGFYGK